MFKVNLRSVYSMAKKEFIDNVRSKWILALIIIFAVLTLLSSYVAGAQAGETLGSMEETVLTLMSTGGIIVPIIAIMLGYASISGDCASGSMGILLSYPIRRGEVLFGKVLGLGMVLVVSVVAGFGIGGIVIAASGGADSAAGYLAFMGLTILTGMLYLSMAIMFSSYAKRRSTALGLGVLLFFWSMIYGMIVFGLFYATGGDFADLLAGNIEFPEWLWASIVFSPTDSYQMMVMYAFGLSTIMGFNFESPWFMTLELLALVQILWTEIALVLAYFLFEKRDI